MNLSKEKFYYFSADLDISGLPTECEFVRNLKNKQKREAVLIHCKKSIKEFGDGYLVVVPRDKNKSFLDLSSTEEVIFVYTYDAKNIIYDEVNFENYRPIDIGGVVADRKVLKKWA